MNTETTNIRRIIEDLKRNTPDVVSLANGQQFKPSTSLILVEYALLKVENGHNDLVTAPEKAALAILDSLVTQILVDNGNAFAKHYRVHGQDPRTLFNAQDGGNPHALHRYHEQELRPLMDSLNIGRIGTSAYNFERCLTCIRHSLEQAIPRKTTAPNTGRLHFAIPIPPAAA